MWIPQAELEEVFIAPDGIVYHERLYPMVPSASAAVVMLRQWLEEKDHADY